MSYNVTYEVLVGSGQDQSVRVIVQVGGAENDTSEEGRLARHELCDSIVDDIVKAADRLGVILKPTKQPLEQALRSAVEPPARNRANSPTGD